MPEMLRLALIAVLPLLVSVTVLVLGNGLLGSLLAVRLDIEHMAVGQIGLIMACYFLGLAVGTRICPRFVALVGHVRVFAAFAAMAAAVSIGHALLAPGPWWALLRVVSGFCTAGLLAASENWIDAYAFDSGNKRVTALYAAVTLAALGGSQYFLVVLDPTKFVGFAVAAIFLCLAVVPVALTPAAPVPRTLSKRLGLRRLMAASKLGVAGCFASGLVMGAFTALAPIYARDLDASRGWVGQFMMVGILGGFLLQVPLAFLSQRLDRRTLFLCTSAGLALSALVLALFGSAADSLMLPLLAIYGAFAAVLYPVAAAHAMETIPEADQLCGSATLLLLVGLGSTIGPVVAGQIMELTGGCGLFLFISAIAGGMALVSAYWLIKRATPQDAPLTHPDSGDDASASEGLMPSVVPVTVTDPVPVLASSVAQGGLTP